MSSAREKALVLERSVASLCIGLTLELTLQTLAANNPDLEITVLRDICCKSVINEENLPPSVKVVSSQTSLRARVYNSSLNTPTLSWTIGLARQKDVEKVLDLGRRCKADQMVYLSPA